jgi:glycosyltransferase involved in cell wall biosynthesis
VVDDGVDGVLVDPNDSGDIAAAILHLLTDPQRGRRMGLAGYEKTRSKFTWDTVTDQVERTYQNLIGASAR